MEIVLANTCRVIAMLLVGASIYRSVQTVRLYYGLDRQLSAEQRKIRLLPRHVWKISVAYLGFCTAIVAAHAVGWGNGMSPLFLDIPFLALGLSSIHDVYKLQRYRAAQRNEIPTITPY